MINLVSKNCIANGYSTLECTISEWQEDERDFFDNLGYVRKFGLLRAWRLAYFFVFKSFLFFRFTTRQIYHKQIIGSSLTVMKSQLTYDLLTDNSLQKQN